MRYDQFEYIKFFNIALHEYKAIYFFIPKVACTSLKKAMGEVLGIYQRTWRERLNPFGSPKVLNEQYYHWQHYPFVTDATLFNDYFKFTFVRNPWDRLISCYYNKVKKGLLRLQTIRLQSRHKFTISLCVCVISPMTKPTVTSGPKLIFSAAQARWISTLLAGWKPLTKISHSCAVKSESMRRRRTNSCALPAAAHERNTIRRNSQNWSARDIRKMSSLSYIDLMTMQPPLVLSKHIRKWGLR